MYGYHSKELKLSHTSLSRSCGGYICKGVTKQVPYQGRFGKGIKVFSHNPNSTRYCLVTYYIDTPPITMGGYTKEITDIFNPEKIWVVKRTVDGHYYLNQKIKGVLFYSKFQRVTKKYLNSININI